MVSDRERLRRKLDKLRDAGSGLTVGDPSGGHSERWNLDVSKHPSGRAVIRHCDQAYGTPGSAEYALVKGKAYTFRLRWIATDPGYTGTPRPDYDWQCLVNDSAAEGARTGLYGTGAFTVEDPGGLLTGETHGNETDITLGREGRIIVPKIVTETVATSPSDRTRKTVGVGEEVTLTLFPKGMSGVLWNMTGGSGQITNKALLKQFFPPTGNPRVMPVQMNPASQ